MSVDKEIRAKLEEMRANLAAAPTREQWQEDQGFIKALEWTLLALERSR